jgi:uncharacterized protein (TIGR03437 family)
VFQNQAPVLAANGELSNSNPDIGAPLAPGAIAQISGLTLAPVTQGAKGAPLPASLAGASVLIGAFQAPLFLVSPNALKVQVPFELAPNRSYTVVAGINGAYTLPTTITVAPAAPAILTDSNGVAMAQDSSAARISEASPAHAGSTVTIFLEGMGVTTPQIATGAAAGSGDVVQIPPSVLLGDQTATILYAGLAPSMIGVYRIDFQVPSDAPAGDLPLTVSQNGVSSNSALLPVR